ncbi:MAG: hypothetical protein L0I62_01365 [Gammaproteobacteria bacterium]|nr:hypothetical protein [Gammaproteobacteria bacterium]
MVFAFYNRLSASRRRVYDRSDRLAAPRLNSALFAEATAALGAALDSGRQPAVREATQVIADGFAAALKLPPVEVVVKRKRPERSGSEYHGLYAGEEDGLVAEITLWMFTARRRQVVAFRTFLRTLVHELCHHLDFGGFQLPESFHTEGFYQRESALFRDIVGEPRDAASSRRPSEREKEEKLSPVGREEETRRGEV